MNLNIMNKMLNLPRNNSVYVYRNISRYSTCIALDKSKFNFSCFYEKYQGYFPNNLLPSYNFLCWFVGFTEAEGSFIVKNRGDLCFVITQSTNDINVL